MSPDTPRPHAPSTATSRGSSMHPAIGTLPNTPNRSRKATQRSILSSPWEGALVKVPVLVSCPTALSPPQQESRRLIDRQLHGGNLEPRTLGQSDYPSEYPLREVLVIARHCAGGVILGFEQFHATEGIHKQGAATEQKLVEPASFPTPGTTSRPASSSASAYPS